MELEPSSKGVKRKPSNDLFDQRFAKRFDLLNLDNKHGKLYVPVSGEDGSSATAKQTKHNRDDQYMELEDSKHKVYIYDLDKELEDCQSDEDKPIFIPDIEKHLSKLPRVVLIGDDAKDAAKNMQMVLYNVPSSLTVPKERDTVRKAIMESRQRMRDKQALTVPEFPTALLSPANMIRAQGGQATLKTPSANKPKEPNALLVLEVGAT